MDDFKQGMLDQEARLKKMENDYANYLRGKYFSGKDIYGEKIFNETAIIGGRTVQLGRLSPIKSYLDPLAYFNEVAEIKKKSLANNMNTEEGDMSSDSLNEGQSARKRAKSEAGPSNKRH